MWNTRQGTLRNHQNVSFFCEIWRKSSSFCVQPVGYFTIQIWGTVLPDSIITTIQTYNAVSLGFSDVDYYNVCFIVHSFFLFLIFFSDSLISDRSTPTLAQDVSSIQGNPGDKDTCPRCGGMVRTVLWLEKRIYNNWSFIFIFLGFSCRANVIKK